MALVSTGFLLAVTLTDQGGNKSVLKYFMDVAQVPTMADAQTTRTGILARLGSVTLSVITHHSLAETFAEDSQFFGVGENENQAMITAKIFGEAGKTVNIFIPNPLQTLFAALNGPDFNNVDPANAALIDYLEIFASPAGVTPIGDVTISDGEHIADPNTPGNFYGIRKHRGTRKG